MYVRELVSDFLWVLPGFFTTKTVGRNMAVILLERYTPIIQLINNEF